MTMQVFNNSKKQSKGFKIASRCLLLLLCIIVFGMFIYFNDILKVGAATYTELRTISGYGYTASIHGIDDMSKNCTRYWSTYKGSNSDINNLIKLNSFYNDDVSENFGAKSISTVPFFDKTYIEKGGLIEFKICGTSCSHSGSDAHVDVFKLETINGVASWKKVWSKDLVVESGYTFHSSTGRFRVDEDGYYRASGYGSAYGCNSSNGHGIFIESNYKYLKCVDKYTIKYNANGGSGAPSQHSYTWDSQVGTIGGIKSDIPVRNGYVFKGWARTAAWNNKRIISHLDTTTIASRDGVMPTRLDDANELFEYEDALGYSRGSLPKTITLYAQWAKEYYVKFDPNGAPIASDAELMDMMTCGFGDKYNMPACEYSRYHYIFNGWSTTPDGTGQIYKTGDEFVDLAANAGDTVTLYAQWLPEKYYVQFDPNGAEITSDADLMAIMTCNFDSKYNIPACTYQKYGCVFNGWSTKPDGSGQTYNTGSEFINLASEADEYITLYAQWVPDVNLQAKLYVDPNSGVYRGSEQVQLFTWSPVSSTTHSYYYTGGYQTFTCPADGWYFLEAMGAQGGSDACAGGKGGYVKSYVKLTKGQKLYIGVGQAGWCSGGAANLAYNPTYGAGGRTACNWDSYPICSGVGGGATIVATELCGNGDIRHYANNKNSLLVVAGGGGGGSNTRAGAGGTVLYNSNGVANGASTSLLNGTFGLGSNHGNASGRAEDGGGGGGGYIGGVVGWDDAGYGSHGSGGGASFVNTSRGCYDAVLIPNYRAGDGFVRITSFPDDAAHVLTPDPYRTGWSFVGWELNNGKSSGAVYLHHNTIEPLWWVDFKKGTAYVQSVWRRTMSITLDADQTMNYINGQAVSRGESTWTQTITDNPTKHFRWDSNVLSSGRTFTNDMTREKGVYTVQLARNDGNGSVMELISLGNTQSSAANGTVGTFGSDDVIIYNSGVYAGEIKTYPRFRGWSTERFVQGEYLGTYKGKVIAGSGSWINLKTQNANRASYKQYLYNIEGNRYPAAGNIGYELDARLAKYNTKLGISPYDKLNITIYPTWYRSTIKLPDAKRNSDKTGNGETPDLFIGWFTEPQLDADTSYGGEFVGRAGDVVVVDRDITLYPWFNKAPTIYRSEIGNGGNSGTFWEGEPISYEQLLTLVNANDKDNYIDISKRNEEIQWNGIDAWEDGISDWNDGEQAWGGDTNAYTPGEDSHGESQNWNDDVANTIDWETFSKTNAWKTLYTLNVDVYLHDYVYNSPDFASLTDVEKDALIEDAKQRLLDYENQYDTNNRDDNKDFQVFITGISYYCDGVDTKGVPTKSNPDVTNVDASGNYLNSHIEKLYSNNYSATNGLYDGYEVEYDNMYDVNANGLQTDTPFVGKIVIHYAIVDNGTFDFYNDKYVSTANGYTIDSNIVVQFDLETEIKFDNRPKFETHSLLIYSNDPDWNSSNVKEKVLAKQILTDVEDNMNNHPWWYKDVTTPALIDTKEILTIENIRFQEYYEHEHEDICNRIKQITDIEELFKLKENGSEEDFEAFTHIVDFDVVIDAHDQWNKYASDERCGLNKTERTFKVIMFNNFDDDDIFYGAYRESLRYITSDWTDTLGETSYWNDSMYGQPALETTFTRYVDRGTLTANSYSGVIVNATPDSSNRTVNITVNDYSD